MKKIITVIFAFCCFMLTQANRVLAQEYHFSPNVHQLEYQEGTFDFGSTPIQLVLQGELDAVTKQKIRQILTQNGIQFTEVTQSDPSVKSVIVRTKMDTDTNQAALFDKVDAYTLKVTDQSIEIVGKDTDATFYGIATLSQLLAQSNQQTLKQLTIEDYADVKYRGFIEGYYGIPWSHDNRKSLMEFGGQIKANTYIFAPKDDIYHNSQWKALYPDNELVKIRELVAKGEETKTKFVWTIHPFMSSARFNFNQYDTDYATLIAKFEQLYNQGVRQFGILADDVGSVDRNQLLRLLTDVGNWAKNKGDVEDILFCPAGYNHAWQGAYAEMKKLNEAPDNVQFFWTGDTVVSPITQGAVDRFRQGTAIPSKSDRNPYFWLNWPVNDYKKTRLLMGPATVLTPGVEHLAGVVTNPMQQAQASKVGIFAVADYAWNTRDFNAQQNWENAFAFIDKTAPEQLKEITKHLQDISPNGHGLQLQESTELLSKLQAFMLKVAANESIKEESVPLLAEYEKLYEATQAYIKTGSNTGLIEEMKPWIDQLAEKANATIHLINAAIALEDNKTDLAWEHYSQAAASVELAKTFTVQNINSVDVVEAGAKRITPFLTVLKEKVSHDVSDSVLPKKEVDVKPTNTLIKSDHFHAVYNGNENNLFDGNHDSHVWYNINGNSLPQGAYIGVDLGNAFKLGQITFLQGTKTNDDTMKNAILEYSLDGQTYTPFSSDVYNTKDIVYDATQHNVTARYVRLRNGEDTQKWTAFREVTVQVADTTPYLYTNVQSLDKTPAKKEDNTFILSPITNATLQPGEYIGLDLQRIRSLASIDVTKTGNVAIYTGENADFLTKVLQEKPSSARYVVLKNDTTEPQTVSIAQFAVESNDVRPISVKETNYTSLENPLAAFDGNTVTQAWLKNSQHAGKYIIYDLGQTITLHHIAQVVSDSEHDYIRHGKISVSENGQDYTDVLVLGDAQEDLDISGVYPDRNVQLLSKSATVPNLATRYIKVEITKDKSGADKWVRFNEILLNEQSELPNTNNPTFVVTPSVKNADRPELAIDKDLNTAFRGSTDGGTLIYNISNTAYLNALTILQSKNVSNAQVSVKNNAGEWVDVGQLDQAVKTFDLKRLKDIVSIRLNWQAGNAPVIYEMYTTPGINRTLLQKKIKDAETLVATDYAEGFEALTNSLESANSELDNDQATQASIDEALNALNEKLAALVPFKQWTADNIVVKTAQTPLLKDTTLNVTKIENALVAAKKHVYDAYELTLVNDKKEPISLQQKATVKLPVKANVSVKEIVRVDNEAVQTIAHTVEDNVAVIEVDALGVYAVVYDQVVVEKEDESSSNQTNDTDNSSSSLESESSVEKEPIEKVTFEDKATGIVVQVKKDTVTGLHLKVDKVGEVDALKKTEHITYDVYFVNDKNERVTYNHEAVIVVPSDRKVKQVVYVSEKNDIENLAFKTQTYNGKQMVAFKVQHFSLYALIFDNKETETTSSNNSTSQQETSVPSSQHTATVTSTTQEKVSRVSTEKASQSETTQSLTKVTSKTLPETSEKVSVFTLLMGIGMCLIAGCVYIIKKKA